MDNDQIQQTNLVSDDAAAAMTDDAHTEIVQPQQPAVASLPAPTSKPAEEPSQTPTTPEPTAIPKPEPEPTATEPASSLGELDEIKKSALDDLQPLIKHVEQSPEERFETVMMMIRSNDDPSLVSQAYEAAKEIENEKIRANALLNIVSEIEYLKSKAKNQAN